MFIFIDTEVKINTNKKVVDYCEFSSLYVEKKLKIIILFFCFLILLFLKGEHFFVFFVDF